MKVEVFNSISRSYSVRLSKWGRRILVWLFVCLVWFVFVWLSGKRWTSLISRKGEERGRRGKEGKEQSAGGGWSGARQLSLLPLGSLPPLEQLPAGPLGPGAAGKPRAAGTTAVLRRFPPTSLDGACMLGTGGQAGVSLSVRVRMGAGGDTPPCKVGRSSPELLDHACSCKKKCGSEAEAKPDPVSNNRENRQELQIVAAIYFYSKILDSLIHS